MSPSGPAPDRNARAELDEDTWCIVVGICDAQRLIDLKIMHIAEPV